MQGLAQGIEVVHTVSPHFLDLDHHSQKEQKGGSALQNTPYLRAI